MEILVDDDGYEQFLTLFNNLKSSLETIAVNGVEACRDAVGDGWHDNFAYEQLMRDEQKVQAQVKKMLMDKKCLKVVKKKTVDDKIIDIGDILKIKVIYDLDDIEVFEVKLSGKYLADLESSPQEISLNSYLGKALYLKNINDDISYKVNDNIVVIKLLEKNGKIIN